MSRDIPQAVRALAGLAATVVDEARRLPETLPGLPVRVISLTLQVTMRLQQSYAGLVARGDEVLTGLRGESEPGLATFDEDLPAPPRAARRGTTPGDGHPTAGAARSSAFDRAAEVVPDEDAEDLADHEVAAVLPDMPRRKRTAGSAADGDGAVATDESGTTVAAATGHRTDVGETGPSGDDAAIAAGAAVNAVGGTAGKADAAPTDDAGGGSELAGSQAAGTAPVEGYDGFTLAQLRGRLRGYPAGTVRELLSYEEATRARAPFLTMLRNRLERLERPGQGDT